MGTQRVCSYGHTEGSLAMGTQGGVWLWVHRGSIAMGTQRGV